MKLFESVALVPKEPEHEMVVAMTAAEPCHYFPLALCAENRRKQCRGALSARPTAELEEAVEATIEAARRIFTDKGQWPMKRRQAELKDRLAKLDLLLPKDKSPGAET
jgi:hypothetical protein